MRRWMTGGSVMMIACVVAGLSWVGTPKADPGEQEELCATGDPSSVLRCLAAAFEARDIEALGSLLAEDFEFVMGGSTSWGYEEELELQTKLFTSSLIKSVSLTIVPGYRLERGEIEGTWVISGVGATLVVEGGAEGELKRHEATSAGHEFRVREVGEPVKHFVIYRWWDPQAE